MANETEAVATGAEREPSVSGEDGELSHVEQLQAENEALRRELAGATKPAGGQGWRRRWLSITCAVLAAILLPVAVLTVWARNTALDTGEYVATVAPLADDENVQEAVSFRVTEVVAEAADFGAIAEEALPEDAQLLAGPIEAGARSLIEQLVNNIVASPAFAELWEEANRVAHENLVPLLKGESSDLVDTADGRVVLRLGSVAQSVVESLDERLGTELATQIPAEQLEAELVLIDSTELANVQTQLRWLDNLSWFSLILAVALLAGAVLFAERRRLGGRRLGLAVVVSMLLALLAYAWARDQYLASLPADVHNPDAAAATFDILTRFVQRAFRALLILGVLVMLGAWVVGPSTTAAKIRAGWDTLLGRAVESGADRELGPIPQTVANHERALLLATAALGALILVLWTHPTGIVVLVIVVVTLLALGAIRLLAEVARRADTTPEDEPDADTDEPRIDHRQPELESALDEPDGVDESSTPTEPA